MPASLTLSQRLRDLADRADAGDGKVDEDLRRLASSTDTPTAPMDTTDTQERLVSLRGMRFAYDPNSAPVLKDLNIDVHAGQRMLLVGLNGAGKSTFLRTLCGHHIASWDKFEVDGIEAEAGRLPWADQHRGLAYLGGVWRRSNGFNGVQPYFQDIAARDMMKAWQEEHSERRDTLVRVLGINLDWNMNRVSDGQRKKVRIMLKLLRPFKLCVIDEFAVELDIMARKRFMDYLARECDERGAAVIYATHIFDQADEWSTHLAFLSGDRTLSPVHELATFEPYQALVRAKAQCPMYRLVLEWMLEQRPGETDPEGGDVAETEETPKRKFNAYDSGFESGRSQEIVRQRELASRS